MQSLGTESWSRALVQSLGTEPWYRALVQTTDFVQKKKQKKKIRSLAEFVVIDTFDDYDTYIRVVSCITVYFINVQ